MTEKRYRTLESVIRTVNSEYAKLLAEREKQDDPTIHADSAKEKKAAKDSLPKHPYISFTDNPEDDDQDSVKKTGKQKSYTDAGFGEEVEVTESNRAANRQGRNQTPAMIKVRELMKKKKAGGRVSSKEFAAAKAAAHAEQEAMTKAKTVKPEPAPKPKKTEPEKAAVDDRASKRVAQSAHRFMINHPQYRRHAADISAHITHLINNNKMPEHLLHKAAVGGDEEIHALVKHSHESMKQQHEKPSISLASIKIKK